ncbi:laminin subunit beta-2-like protein [Leptotrombidium deliense]|uniref:Laminin subunit beta-2-like protein n=1 Tax=Leptotrombidium deliense TaxID=299467 RepID=A0A443RXX6_9ACAR|nr:laminin subunit beta-2-like protein [Leptotrombidium deliense]
MNTENSTSFHMLHTVIKDDENANDFWWQSESLAQNVSLRLDLETFFQVTKIKIVFKWFLPKAMVIEKSMDFGKTWTPVKYIANDCSKSFKYFRAFQQGNRNELCKAIFYELSSQPKSRNDVTFYVVNSAQLDEDITELTLATNIRITLTEFQDLLLSNNSDSETKFFNNTQFYAISFVEINGSCYCNGHASRCVANDSITEEVKAMVHPKCECDHHTTGEHCEQCEAMYNDQPWKPSYISVTWI